MKKFSTLDIAKAIYEAECQRLGKRADCWETHEEDAIRYWQTVIKLGMKEWWNRATRKHLEETFNYEL